MVSTICLQHPNQSVSKLRWLAYVLLLDSFVILFLIRRTWFRAWGFFFQEPLKNLSDGLRVTLDFCIAGKKTDAQACLKKVKADWTSALKVERERVREHFILDATSAKHAADVDDDGYKPLVPTTQLYEVTPKSRLRARRSSVLEYAQPAVGVARGIRGGQAEGLINHGSAARQEAAALRDAHLLSERHLAQTTNIQEADMMHLYTPEMVSAKHEHHTKTVRGDLAKETVELVSEGAKSNRTDWGASPAGEDHLSHAEAMLLFNKKSHLHESIGGK
jgi:hypothetical protein